MNWMFNKVMKFDFQKTKTQSRADLKETAKDTKSSMASAKSIIYKELSHKPFFSSLRGTCGDKSKGESL